MIKKKKKNPPGCRRRDMSSTNEQHSKDLYTSLKIFREFPVLRSSKLLFLPTLITIITKYSDLNRLLLIVVIFPLIIRWILENATYIIIEYKKLKILVRTNIAHENK
jgi:hypothetical protein